MKKVLILFFLILGASTQCHRGPSYALKIKLQKGETFTQETHMQMKMEIQAQDMHVPTEQELRTWMEVKADSVTPEGHLKCLYFQALCLAHAHGRQPGRESGYR
ncbi:MAG: hypothetical protein N2050_11440 [Flavobacteriales bacterium]|nr:hypothetical protein [Flavobacteriales bacterium]